MGAGKPDRWKPLEGLAAAGNTSHQIAKKLGVHREAVVREALRRGIILHADRVVGKSRKVDPNRVLREFISALESLAPSCDLIEPGKVDRKILREGIETFDEAMRALNRLRRRLNREGNR